MALFVPKNSCPVPLTQLANDRRTIVRGPNGNNEDIEDQYPTLSKQAQKQVLKGHPWRGETWFKVNKTTRAPEQFTPPTIQARAKTKAAATTPQSLATRPQAAATAEQPQQPTEE